MYTGLKEQKDSVAPCFLFPTDACGSVALEEILVLQDGPVRTGKPDNCILSPDCCPGPVSWVLIDKRFSGHFPNIPLHLYYGQQQRLIDQISVLIQ